jgi:hypothetical protein
MNTDIFAALAVPCDSAPGRKPNIFRRCHRFWCRYFHGPIMFAGGREYECRRCGMKHPSPAFNGPVPTPLHPVGSVRKIADKPPLGKLRRIV